MSARPSVKSRVLLIEDEEALRLFIGDSLRSEGYEVEPCHVRHPGGMVEELAPGCNRGGRLHWPFPAIE